MATQPSPTPAQGLRQLLRARPLVGFFFLAYALAWLISLPYTLAVWGLIGGDYSLGLMLKQWAGPALAAIIMTRATAGQQGMLQLRRRNRQWRVGLRWYLFILLGIPALMLVGIAAQPGALAGFQGLTPSVLVSYPFVFVAVFIGVGLPEELGWRGFALPHLQERYGPLRGSLLLGVLWAGWHLPYFLLPDHGGGPGADIAAVATNIAIFFVMVVALCIVFTWVFNHTGGSVLLAALLHTAIDAPQLVWAPLFLEVGAANSTAGEMGLDLALLIVFGALALAIVALTRGRLGLRPAERRPPGPAADKARLVQ